MSSVDPQLVPLSNKPSIGHPCFDDPGHWTLKGNGNTTEKSVCICSSDVTQLQVKTDP